MRRFLLATAAAVTLAGPAGRADDPKPDRVGRIIVEGNTATPDGFLLHLVRLYPGQVLKYPELDRAAKRLAATGLFGIDRPPTVEVLPNEFDSEFRDVVIRVEERPGNRAIWAAVDVVVPFLNGDEWRVGRHHITRLAAGVADAGGKVGAMVAGR